MERLELVATRRAATGKRRMSRSRRQGVIPGVIYGKSVEPTPIVVTQRDLIHLLRARAGEHGLVTLKLQAAEGAAKGKGGAKAEWEKPVLIKAMQRDGVTGEILHIDFHAIALTERVRVKIPIVLKGEPVGVKQDGGVLEHFMRDIEVDCLPTQIPKQVEFDVSAMAIGQTVHVSDLLPPAGSKFTTDLGAAVASVLAPKIEAPVEAAAETAAEPEVIREKKPEEGEAAEATGKDAGKKEEKPKAEAKDEKKEK